MIIPNANAVTLKYHIIVIAIYVLVCVYFFFFRSSPYSYFTFDKKDLIYFIPISLATFVVLFFANSILHYGTVGLNGMSFGGILVTVAYSLLFAIPEEIIFRGIIAKNLEGYLGSIAAAVVVSALIFGAAHLLNGATGMGPSGWDWKLAGMTGVAGLFLGYTYFSTGSLILPIALHALLIIANQFFIRI